MYRIIKPSDELYHYGVKGMKWGVRRYQNYDGTRIGTGGKPMINADKQAGKRLAGGRNTIAGGQGGKAKGAARLAANVSKLNLASSAANASSNKDSTESEEKKSGMFDKSIKQGKGREDISPAEQINKSFKSGTESAKKVTDTMSKYDQKVKKAGDAAEKEAKKMSDKELRDKINRIKMEREYRSLAESEVESGWTKAGEVLEVVGDVASITLAVLGIVATIRSLKHDGLDYADSESELKSLLDLGDYDDDFIAHALDLDSEYIEDYLEHHGVKGMKWGVRRYQNYDGTRIGTGGGGGGSQSPKSSRKTVAGGGGPRLAAKTPGSSRVKTAGQGLKNAMREQKELSKAVKDAVTRPLDERRANAQAAHKEAADAIKNGLNKIVKDGHAEAKSKKYGPEPEGYSESRQLEERRMREKIDSAKTFNEKRDAKREYKDFHKESLKKADEYFNWEKSVRDFTGDPKSYKPIMDGEKFTKKYENKRTGQIITDTEFLTAQRYDMMKNMKRLR